MPAIRCAWHAFLKRCYGPTDGRTNGQMNGPTDGQTLLQRCVGASKKLHKLYENSTNWDQADLPSSTSSEIRQKSKSTMHFF